MPAMETVSRDDIEASTKCPWIHNHYKTNDTHVAAGLPVEVEMVCHACHASIKIRYSPKPNGLPIAEEKVWGARDTFLRKHQDCRDKCEPHRDYKTSCSPLRKGNVPLFDFTLSLS